MSSGPEVQQADASSVGSAQVLSDSWDVGGRPRISAVVSTFRRPSFLAGLVEALEGQTLDSADYEIIVVDNGSGDETWAVLSDIVRASSARVAGVQLAENRGPGGGRNAAVAAARAPLVAFTDDDCLPSPGWLRATLDTFEAGADVIQGQVHADPADRDQMGPWDHTKWITEPTPFFETCNASYRRSYFDQVGGFDEADELTAQASGGRAFGEDAYLAWRVQRAGGTPAFAPDSLVYHRVIPGVFTDHLQGQRYLVGFPGLGKLSPVVAAAFWHRVFLTKETALFDAAVASVALAALRRNPLLLVGAVPWFRMRLRRARWLARHEPDKVAVRFAQLAAADGVGLWALVRGSIRHRRLVI